MRAAPSLGAGHIGQPVTEAVGSLGPELDYIRCDPDRAPVLRAGHGTISQLGLQRFESGAQTVEVVDYLALP